MRTTTALTIVIGLAAGMVARGQEAAPRVATSKEAIAAGVQVLLKLQEAPSQEPDAPKAQWPYEGVYRVGGKIPVGYRVGGTAIVILALAQAPGLAEDAPRKEAIARGLKYLCEAITEPDMSTENYDGNYDVRIWGDIEGTLCLCRLKRLNLLSTEQLAAANPAIDFYLDGIIKLEMPKTGGWNYARPAGRETAGSPASFVTGAALQALFEAAAAGYKVESAVIERGLSVLEKARAASGSIVYSGEAGGRESTSNGVPGAVGRMTLAESTLVLAGRSSQAMVRGSVDAFIVHWEWLDKRRAKTGTHVAPYMVAPYYFMFAHHYAAQAIELLPKSERVEYRRRVNDLLLSVRQEDGSWNDRVFPRSAGYGTAMAMLALMQPGLETPAWNPHPPPAAPQ